ncbi:MAG: UMP kinase [Thermoplasmata archaeon]
MREKIGSDEKKIVISLGGSIVSKNNLNVDYLQKFARMLIESDVSHAGIIVGGGLLARTYISLLREKGVNENILDEIGIHATRINALSLIPFLEDVNIRIPETVNEAADLMDSHRFVVMGGTEPGHTTDTVAALLSERTETGILINATSVDGVYTDDPKKNSQAKKINRISYEDAIKLSSENSRGAGPNVFMDITSLTIAMRSNIKIYVVDGNDLNEIKNAMAGSKISGTVIGD